MQHKEFKPTSWAIDNKTTIYIITFIVTIAGFMIYGKLPKEQFPDIVIPQFVVATIYPGTSPEDMENLITKPIEKQLKSVSGIKKIKSQSIADFSMVTVEFNTGVAVAVAKQKVQDAVDKSKSDLPTDMDNDPTVQEVDFSEFPIMNINVSGNYSLDKLKKFAEMFQDEIEAMPEITRVDIIGALNREIQINVDVYRMQAAGFSFRDIEGAIASENVNISGGELNVDDVRRTLRVTGEFKDMESIRNIVVRSATGTSVLLRDIADVEDSYAERQDFARLDGKSVITMNVIKRAGTNLIAASDKIEEISERLQKTKLPAGVNVTLTGDQSEKTRVQLNDLINSVILGFIFVVLVLMFFMGTTNAIFVGLAVPLSILLAFLFMPSLHYSLNVIVMFSFLLGLGIVVDDAIVVIENTHRILHDHEELTITQAAKMAAGEVFLPVLSGTLTNVAPFFPLLFWPGIVGEFMKYLPVTLIITLFASLIVAFIMNPVFAVSFMDKVDHNEKKDNGLKSLVKPLLILLVLTGISYSIGFGFGNFMATITVLYLVNHFIFNPMIAGFQGTLLPAFMNQYRRFINFLIQGYRPYGALGLVIAMFIGVIALFVGSKPKVEFFPGGEPNFVYVYNQMPIGTDAHVTDSVTRILEQRVNEVIAPNRQYVKSVISNVGIGAGDPQNPDRVVAPHKSKITVAFVNFDERLGVSTSTILSDIRKKLEGIPGTEISVEKERAGPPTGKPIAIEIAGEDFTILNQLEKSVKAEIQKAGIKGIEDLRSDLVLNKPEIIVDIDRIKATQQGISTAQIAMEIRNALYGKEISQFRDAKEEYPIMLRLKVDNRNQIEKLVNLNISYRDMAVGGAFRQVPISTLATIRYESAYSSVNRKNQERMVTLSSNVLNGYNANEVVAEINQAIQNLDTPSGYTVRMGGEQEDQKETSDFLGIAFLMALGMIFVILVTQFNSVSKPFIIFGTVVLSLIGVLLGFALTKMTMSIVMTGVGVIALAGIVVKNGIILIEFIDELRNRGYGLSKAITEAAAIRLTPVVLTASSAVLGLIPLALGLNINFETLFTHGDPEFFLGGDSVVFWGPLAWTIIFGLTFSTFLTLIIVPAMYYAIERIKLRVAGRLHEAEVETYKPLESEFPVIDAV
ncbi:MAG TPA: efflux RND transporter permease subunit [Catalimonadaceae bacterium]|nr:efflux RND transporter permease subunit [Catalimonadaceae bacterium]HPI11510.1 efflux RND transporter permease subunit [Catalimonadaceae bacterium]